MPHWQLYRKCGTFLPLVGVSNPPQDIRSAQQPVIDASQYGNAVLVSVDAVLGVRGGAPLSSHGNRVVPSALKKTASGFLTRSDGPVVEEWNPSRVMPSSGGGGTSGAGVGGASSGSQPWQQMRGGDRRAALTRQVSQVFADAVVVMDKEQAGAHRGIPQQLYAQVRSIFGEMLRRNHVVFAVFLADGDAELLITRPQRVLVLACLVFTSMCVTAMLLGRRPDQVEGRIVAGIIAAGCMLPCRLLLPMLFKSANAAPSRAASAVLDKQRRSLDKSLALIGAVKRSGFSSRDVAEGNEFVILMPCGAGSTMCSM